MSDLIKQQTAAVKSILATTKTIDERNIKDVCMYVIADRADWEITKDLYTQFKAVYDGFAGWYINKKYKYSLEEFCTSNNIICYEQSIPDEYEHFTRKNTSTLLHAKLESTEREISSAVAQLDLKVKSIDYEYLWNLKESLIAKQQGKKLLMLLGARKKLLENISYMERSFYQGIPATKTEAHRDLSLKFLNEYPNNFLLTPAPPLPSLLCDEQKNVFIPRGIVASLIGAGGVGKTHWCTQLAFSVALGNKFLGKYSPGKAGNAALIVGENSQDDIHRVLQKTVIGFFGHEKTAEFDQALLDVSKRLLVSSVTGLDASFVSRAGSPSPFYKQLLEQLVNKEPESGWDLIILDPASRFLGPNAEIDNAAATVFIAQLENLVQTLRGKPTILFAHHMSKNAIGSQDTDATASRGASGLTDGVRLQINLEKVSKDEAEKNKIKMKVAKTNHTAIPEEEIITKDFQGHLTIKDKKLMPDNQARRANDKEEYESKQRVLLKTTYRK